MLLEEEKKNPIHCRRENFLSNVSLKDALYTKKEGCPKERYEFSDDFSMMN